MFKKRVLFLVFCLGMIFGVNQALAEVNPNNQDAIVVNYDAKGGRVNSKSTYTTTVTSNKQIYLETNISRTNYTFVGWYFESSYQHKADTYYSSSYNLLNAYNKATGNTNNTVSLYARWISNSELNSAIEISYNPNGGETILATPQNGKIILATAKRDGYTFGGWYFDKELTKPAKYEYSPATSIYAESSVEANQTKISVYAKWIQNLDLNSSLVINYNPNGGETILATPQNGKIILATAKRDGYTFDGWYFDKALTKKAKSVYSPASTIYDESSVEVNQTQISLYAKWIQNSSKKTTDEAVVKVEYYTDGGTVSEAITSATAGMKLNLVTPKKDGYTFDGWYFDKNLTVKAKSSYDNPKSILNDAIMIDSKSDTCPIVIVYAKWIKNDEPITGDPVVKVRYNPNGGTVTSATTASTASQHLNLIISTRDGYSFDGWYFDKELTKKANSSYDDPKSILNDAIVVDNKSESYPIVDVYAKWLKQYGNSEVQVLINETGNEKVKSVDIKKYENVSAFSRFSKITGSKIVAYEIDLLNSANVKIQPSGFVYILLDIPETFDKNNLIVYRVNGDELIPYGVTVSGNKAIIQSNHFSTYILAEKVAVVEEETTTVVKDNNITYNPETGDNTFIFIFVGVVLLCGIFFITRKLNLKNN